MTRTKVSGFVHEMPSAWDDAQGGREPTTFAHLVLPQEKEDERSLRPGFSAVAS